MKKNEFQYAKILDGNQYNFDWNERMNKYIGRIMKIYKNSSYLDFHIVADSQNENSGRGKWFFKKEWLKIIKRKDKFIEVQE